MPKSPPTSGEEAFLEFIPQGRFVKVTAIDPASGIEASIVGDARTPQAQLSRLAVQKLRYVMQKKADEKR